MTRMLNSNKGVTLIEIIVVVIIVALLAFIAGAVSRNYYGKAMSAEGIALINKISECQDNIYIINNDKYEATSGIVQFHVFANDSELDARSNKYFRWFDMRLMKDGYRARAIHYRNGNDRNDGGNVVVFESYLDKPMTIRHDSWEGNENIPE